MNEVEKYGKETKDFSAINGGVNVWERKVMENCSVV